MCAVTAKLWFFRPWKIDPRYPTFFRLRPLNLCELVDMCAMFFFYCNLNNLLRRTSARYRLVQSAFCVEFCPGRQHDSVAKCNCPWIIACVIIWNNVCAQLINLHFRINAKRFCTIRIERKFWSFLLFSFRIRTLGYKTKFSEILSTDIVWA